MPSTPSSPSRKWRRHLLTVEATILARRGDAERVSVDDLHVERVVSRLQAGYERYITFAMGLFGNAARRSAAKQDKLRFALEQAHISMMPEAYVAVTWLHTIVAAFGFYLILALGMAVGIALGRPPSPAVGAALLVLPIMVAATVYVGVATYPDYRAGERRRAIDRDLPYAVNYIAAMSSAGVIPTALLRDLAREKTYGEVAREMAWIVRDLNLLGYDLLTALQHGIARSPSRRFQEFLQGAKTTILSGGDLQAYFSSKADQYMADNRRIQKEYLESLGLMAESYVTVVIAGPLFMIVMLSIMLIVGRSTDSAELFLFFLIFIMLPIAHTGFTWVIRNLTPEG